MSRILSTAALLPLLVILVCDSSAVAQSESQENRSPDSYFKKEVVQVGQGKSTCTWSLWEQLGQDDEETLSQPAKVCETVGRTPDSDASCTEARISDLAFPYDGRLESIQISPKEKAALFTAQSSFDAGSDRKFVALLQRTTGGSIRNLLPQLSLPENSEFRFWELPTSTKFLLFSAAVPVRAEGETMFSAHRFTVRTYKYDETEQGYTLVDEYQTSMKYPGLDDADEVKVIEGELAKIKGHLMGNQDPPASKATQPSPVVRLVPGT